MGDIIALHQPTLVCPTPPDDLQEEGFMFVAAPELHRFIVEAFIQPDGPFHRDEYAILAEARIGVQWTNMPKNKGMVEWAAQAEIINASGDAWSKGIDWMVMADWFGDWWTPDQGDEGDLPNFRLTFYGPSWMESNVTGRCATIAHELRHCAQKLDRNGEPRFDMDDRPVWGIRAHDVETFVSVVEDFGAETERNVKELVAAALRAPRFPGALVEGICGTCGRIAA